MIGKNFFYNGTAIPYTTAQGRAAGWYAEFKWTGMQTRNFTTSRQDFHGTISKPTYADGKLIEVKGEIFSANKMTRGTVKNIVANLFKIEDFPANVDELKKLAFTDDDGTDWFIWCKVYTMPDYTNDRADPVIVFTFQLYAPDPLVLSAILQSASGIYGLLGGIQLPVQLPTQLFGILNPVTCINTGNFAAKAKITISGQIINPKIYNLTTGRFFKLNLSMVAGDVLVIDTNNATASLNGSNVLGQRVDGSNWLFVNSGTNYFLLGGDDFDFDNQNKATIQIQWYHTKLV